MEIELNPLITSLPKPTDKSTLNVRYGLIPPFAYAHIYWDKEKNEVIYEIEEPILNEKEKAIFKKLEEGFKEVINIDVLVEKNTAGILDYIEKTVKTLTAELNISIPVNSYEKIVYYLFRNFMGMNELEPLLRDYHIEDVECNGVGTPVFVVHRSYRTIKTNLVYKDMEELANFVEKLAQKCGRYISYASPLLDGALPDGSLDYNEPFVYKEKGVVKISKIGKFVDKFYKEGISNIPMKVKDIEVPCFDKETLKVGWKKLDYVYRHKNKEDLYKLDLEFGRSVTLTGAHSLFTLTKDGIKAKKMSEVNEKDYVVIPLRIPENDVIKDVNLAKELAESSYFKKISISNVSANIFEDKKLEIKEYLKKNYKNPYQAYYEIRKKKILPVSLWNIIPEEKLKECKISTTSAVRIPAYLNISKELMRLLGYYIAEGWTTDIRNWKKIQFCLNKNEKDLIEDIKACFKKCFDTEIYVEPEEKNAVKLTLNSLLVWLVFNEVLKVSHYAKTKEVPEIVLNVGKELQQEFLKSWQAGDFGSTASKKLAEDISYLSLFSGKVAPFYEREKIGNIKGRNIQTHEHYTNFFRRQESGFPSMIPLGMFNPLNKTSHRFQNMKISRERLKKMLNENRYSRFKDLGNAPAKFLKEWENRGFLKEKELTSKGEELIEDINIVNKLISSDLGFVKVKGIEKAKSSSEYVYDVSVPGLENFIGGTGGVMCHNSRVNATYTKDVTSRGPTFTIRKFTKIPWTPVQLITSNAVCPEMLAYLWLLVEHKSNILIAGGTGSGKTTLLNAVAFFIPPEARVVSIEDSVTGDSKIIIKEKEKIRNITIKELVEKKIDAEVMTLDEKGGIIFVKPSAYIKHKVKKDIYEILTSTGRRLKVTKDHSLFSLGDKGVVEIKPTELKENASFIAVPRSLPICGQELKEINLMNHLECFKEDFLCGEPIKKIFKKYSLEEMGVKKERRRWWRNHNLIKISEFLKLNYKFSDEELKKIVIKSKNRAFIPVRFEITSKFLEFCGLWLGDGSYDNHNKNSVILSNKDKECRQVFKDIAGYLKSNFSVMNDGGVSLRIHSSVFYKFMKYVLGFDGYSDTKKIPEFIFGLSNEQIKHFIRGYFSADGCIKKNEASCSSQSYELLESLQTMFLRLGIISRINDFERKDKCINISISSFENLAKFKEIGFLQERKNQKLGLMNKKASHTCSDIIPLTSQKLQELNKIANEKLQSRYLNGFQNIGREYMQKISPFGSEFNDLSHSDILWDKVKKIRKISLDEAEVFDLSIPKHEKFVCNNIFVHNTRELNLPRENWVPSVARAAAGTKKVGEVDLFDLLKNSFRQTPEYVIVGEVRGKEAFVLFQGMASGHAAISTIHAESVDTIIKRLSTPPIELSPSLINILDAIALMTHAVVNKQETRRVTKITEIINVPEVGAASVNTPFIWNAAEDKFYFKKDSRVFEKMTEKYGMSAEDLWKEWDIRKRLLEEMANRKMFSFEQFQKDINEYYKNPGAVLKRYGIE